MKPKLVLAVLCMGIFNQSQCVIANSIINPSVIFSDYSSYENLGWSGEYYAVENNEGKKAIFYNDKQTTNFLYSYISLDPTITSFIVAEKRNGVDYYGMLDSSYIINEEYLEDDTPNDLIPLIYKSVEHAVINGIDVFISTDFQDNKEYYLITVDFLSVKESNTNPTYNIEYENIGKLIKLKSIDDMPSSKYSETETKTPIVGMDGYYIQSDSSGFYMNIVDENGKKLVDTNFKSVENELREGEILVVYNVVGMNNSSVGALNKNLEVIVAGDYTDLEIIKQGDNIYIKVKNFYDESIDYYDINGNIIEKQIETIPNGDISYSNWAKESIENAIALDIVPQDLRSNYTSNITRKEFCKLAIQAYIIKTGASIDFDIESPFVDVNDSYVTAAYNLKIVAGIGNNKFAPDNNITRQEAAVMLNNLANVLGINTSNTRNEKFVDESYFANWAKNEIYTVSAIKSGDIYVMMGTENGKFSPWMNYTREQAIATMLRLYVC